MSKKRNAIALPNKQLWVVQLQNTERTIYVFAERWVEVRAFGSVQLQTYGDFDKLFISAVMADRPVYAALFANAEGVFDIQHIGNHSNNTHETKIVEINLERS